MTVFPVYFRLFLLVSLAVLAGNQDLVAQNASKTQSIQMTETGWQVICRALGQDRTKLGCSLLHETYSQQDRARVMAIEIVKGDKARSLIVTVPQGVSLKEGIEFAIERGLSVFEPGAQGEHKISRGFLPVRTHSYHWIGHEGFRDAIARHVILENQQMESYIRSCEARSPYRVAAC